MGRSQLIDLLIIGLLNFIPDIDCTSSTLPGSIRTIYRRDPAAVHAHFSRLVTDITSHRRVRRAETFGDQVRTVEDLYRRFRTSPGTIAGVTQICEESGFQQPLVEECLDTISQTYRKIDGSCNNLVQPFWGKAGTPFLRLQSAAYSDGVSAFRSAEDGGSLPSARKISLTVTGNRETFDPFGGSDFIMHFGQYFDHDLDSAPTEAEQCSNCLDTNVCAHIPLDNDPVINGECIVFRRSLPTVNLDCMPGTRNQINQATSFLDASTVYGSNTNLQNTLRESYGGLMKTIPRDNGRKPLLPNDPNKANCASTTPTVQCALTGDGRAAEQPGLTGLHTMFVREHNRIASELGKMNPHWTNNKLYHETRKIVGAMTQHIVYNEYVPLMVGKDNVKKYGLKIGDNSYSGYNQTVNPSISHSFASASFRNGHSQIANEMLRVNQDFVPVYPSLPLRFAFFNASHAYDFDNGGLEAVLLGTLILPVQKIDINFAEAINHLLFADPEKIFGMDLVAMNTQRGRDHGIPVYNDWREFCGLSRAQIFEDLVDVMDNETINMFKAVYGSVNDIDAFVGMFSERILPGTLQGPTPACLVAREFRRIRYGDRFWYENKEGRQAFTAEQITSIRNANMARILCDNLDDIQYIQPYVFRLPGESSLGRRYYSFVEFSRSEEYPAYDGSLPGFTNLRADCQNIRAIPKIHLWPWKENINGHCSN